MNRVLIVYCNNWDSCQILFGSINLFLYIKVYKIQIWLTRPKIEQPIISELLMKILLEYWQVIVII